MLMMYDNVCRWIERNLDNRRDGGRHAAADNDPRDGDNVLTAASQRAQSPTCCRPADPRRLVP